MLSGNSVVGVPDFVRSGTGRGRGKVTFGAQEREVAVFYSISHSFLGKCQTHEHPGFP